MHIEHVEYYSYIIWKMGIGDTETALAAFNRFPCDATVMRVTEDNQLIFKEYPVLLEKGYDEFEDVILTVTINGNVITVDDPFEIDQFLRDVL